MPSETVAFSGAGPFAGSQHHTRAALSPLDIFWVRDESLEDTDNLPPPEAIAAEIVEDWTAALAEFAAVAESLARPIAS